MRNFWGRALRGFWSSLLRWFESHKLRAGTGHATLLPTRVSSSQFTPTQEPVNHPLEARIREEIAFTVPVNSAQETVKSGQDGLLPTNLFMRIFISYLAGYVVFNPR